MAAGVAGKTMAVTALDTWRRWLEAKEDEDRDPPTIADLRKDLLERVETAPMLAGTAGHLVLERPSDFIDPFAARGFSAQAHVSLDEYIPDPFDDEPDVIERTARPDADLFIDSGDYMVVHVENDDGRMVTVDLSFQLPDETTMRLLPVRETKVEKDYATTVGLVTLKGRLDGFDGVEVTDNKFTKNPGKNKWTDSYFFEELDRSWQWKAYLDITGARCFRWEVFTMKPPLKNEKAWRIQQHQTHRQYRYPSLGADVQRAVEGFARLIDLYVPEYWARAERQAAAVAAVEE